MERGEGLVLAFREGTAGSRVGRRCPLRHLAAERRQLAGGDKGAGRAGGEREGAGFAGKAIH